MQVFIVLEKVFIVLEICEGSTGRDGVHDEVEVFAGAYTSRWDAENAIGLENARRRDENGEKYREDGKFVVIEQVLGQRIYGY